jgi:3'(2'), 5'-bisphosphate nucleotidase
MAGYEILDEYENLDVEVELKIDDSPLTVADRRALMLIYESLSTQFLDIDVVSEEGECELSEGKNGIFFLVDPLDGTKEFLKRTGEFTVNIALVCNGRSALGVVYVPVEKTFTPLQEMDGRLYDDQRPWRMNLVLKKKSVVGPFLQMDQQS